MPTPTSLAFTVFLHGVGHSGDSANEINFAFSNQNPLTTTRPVTVEVYFEEPQPTPLPPVLTLVTTVTGTITYQAAGGVFTGTVSMGTLPSNTFLVKIKSDKYLRQVVGLPTIIAGTVNTMPQVTLVTGDIVNDNILDILDYNQLYGCYSVDAPARNCNASQKFQADLNDDGNVDQYDYNLFIRELGNRIGG